MSRREENEDELFVGWAAEAPRADRRFLLAAGLAFVAGAAGAGAGMAMRRPQAGLGRWDQSAVATYAGTLVEDPYPTLLAPDGAGGLLPMLLVGYGKVALPRLGAPPGEVTLEASAIRRGRETMLAIADVDAYARLARAPTERAPPPEADLGPALRLGEILDAKCWFGAMNPGFGLTHKACAALCARGRLPLAFCEIGACAGEGGEVSLLLDADGRPHGPALVPFAGDVVIADGRLVRRNGLLEFRVAPGAIRRA